MEDIAGGTLDVSGASFYGVLQQEVSAAESTNLGVWQEVIRSDAGC